MDDHIDKFQASVWNEKISKMKNMIRRLHRGLVKIMCNICLAEMVPHEHYDFDHEPHHKKQYVCSRCGQSDYIIV